MRRACLINIIRNTDIACAVRPVAVEHHLTMADTRDALIALQVPEAAEIAVLVGTP